MYRYGMYRYGMYRYGMCRYGMYRYGMSLPPHPIMAITKNRIQNGRLIAKKVYSL